MAILRRWTFCSLLVNSRIMPAISPYFFFLQIQTQHPSNDCPAMGTMYSRCFWGKQSSINSVFCTLIAPYSAGAMPGPVFPSRRHREAYCRWHRLLKTCDSGVLGPLSWYPPAGFQGSLSVCLLSACASNPKQP